MEHSCCSCKLTRARSSQAKAEAAIAAAGPASAPCCAATHVVAPPQTTLLIGQNPTTPSGCRLAVADAAGVCVGAGSGVDALLAFASGELGEALDAEKGAGMTDHAIFNAHARKYELEYLEDMAALGVRDADVMTRVTEYVPKIIDFVQKIVDKGLAYKGASGSVYLDIDAFKAKGHHYRKLAPSSGDTSEADMAEGEGALGADAAEKKNPNDFALWKNSKPGEPKWDSPVRQMHQPRAGWSDHLQ